MDGILVVDKPLGLSSHDVVSKARRVLGTKKIGHSGTLDVEASGVLVLGVNKGTKLLNYLNQDDKAYQFRAFFGKTTDTLDHTGTVVEAKPINSLHGIDQVLERFLGTYMQVPPAYSAVKVKGKKLYEYARNNETIPEVKAREISLYQLKRVGEVIAGEDGFYADFYVHSSKGLYVRELAKDIALKLHTLAYTTKIHRVRAGDFTLDEAVSFEAFLAHDFSLISLSDALKGMPYVEATKEEVLRIKNGQTLILDHTAPLLKLTLKGELLAIYEKKEQHYKAKNVFM